MSIKLYYNIYFFKLGCTVKNQWAKKNYIVGLLFEKRVSLTWQFVRGNFKQSSPGRILVFVFSIQRLEYFLGQIWYICYYWENLRISRYIYFLLLQKYTLTVFICLRRVLCGVLPWLQLVCIIIIIKCLLLISTHLPCLLTSSCCIVKSEEKIQNYWKTFNHALCLYTLCWCTINFKGMFLFVIFFTIASQEQHN